MEKELNKLEDPLTMKSLLVLYSYHHHNTEKIAKVFAKVLGAEIKNPQEIKPDDLQELDLVGFGSGIYAYKQHKTLLGFVDRLPQVEGKKHLYSQPVVQKWVQEWLKLHLNSTRNSGKNCNPKAT